MPGKPISDPGFQATRWSLVAALDHDQDTPGMHRVRAPARQRLLELCLRYWYPVYVYLRRSGHSAEAAQALAASFFDTLLQRRGSGAEPRPRRALPHVPAGRTAPIPRRVRAGRARRRRHACRSTRTCRSRRWRNSKRGASAKAIAGGSPELALRRGFALEVIAQAMRRIEDEAREAGRLPMFTALQPYLASDPVPGIYADIAQRLDVSPLFLSLALKRLRERFRELVDDELAQTVASAAALEEERRSLHAALQSAA